MKPIYIVQNCAAEGPGNITPVLDKNKIFYKIVHSYNDDALPIIDSLSGIIVLGTPQSAARFKEFPQLVKLHDLMSSAVSNKIPVLGICFGAQLLSVVLGGRIGRNPVKELGICRINLTPEGRRDAFFAGFEPQFPVFQWHADTFSIPEGAVRLAESDDCRNQAFRMGNSIGFQFHFEPVSEDVREYCRIYADELAEMNMKAETVLADFEREAKKLSTFNELILKRFISLL